MLSSWRSLFDASSVEEVEALACKEGLRLAVEWIRDRVILETDYATFARAIRQKETRSSLCFILEDIRECISELPDVVIRTVKRECNCAAHELAQLAKRIVHTAVWHAQVLRCIERVIAQECNNLSE
ncbi:hypothetical protein PR202_gb25343 [Eleusine coracana subsp. coracana]|uniref:RNase H type-1 domain-containing protein n=1 Tax=Eleusine coracana subsp. coracana TaxID=191504 RepID=A0AAV5FNL6_ELECO|nr:hypothetical protein PR202_gb25298 [Eleusine coracana subsp. coracana]GJN36482.1 hypothetical protein PR202_gb25343 [Eleusine coracana subsp. coracana]